MIDRILNFIPYALMSLGAVVVIWFLAVGATDTYFRAIRPWYWDVATMAGFDK